MSANQSLDQLLAEEELLALPDVAQLLGVVVTRVHDLLGDNKLIAYTREGKRYVPAAIFGGKDELSKFVSGLITLLKDGGFSDEDILSYLFTEDSSLPGRPVDALHGQLAREVLRRAQAMAF